MITPLIYLKVVTSEKVGWSGIASTLRTWYEGVLIGVLFLHCATIKAKYNSTNGLWPRVRTRLFELIATQNRALRALPPIAASLPPKNKK